MSWIIYKPNFEYKSDYNDFNTPWVGHNFFGYDLVRNIKPNIIVELGTHKGTSLYTFAQAAKDASLSTEIFAVDSWEGDLHASKKDEGYNDTGMGLTAYDLVKHLVRKFYGKTQVRLMKMYFNEAVKSFDDSTVDVLHIDGQHNYEDVKDDYSSWISKLSKDGTILFHDVMVADFGVWKLWNELKSQEKDFVFITLKNSYGLGVMTKNQKLIDAYNANPDEFTAQYEKASNDELLSKTTIQLELLQHENLELSNLVREKDKEIQAHTDLVNQLKQELSTKSDSSHNQTSSRASKIFKKLSSNKG